MQAPVQENATSSIQWIIHRPKRGWYIRLRTPSFPPNSFISLTPLPQSSPYHTEAALTFSCRTNLPPTYDATAASSKASLDSEATLADSRRDSAHSYPPTPPAQGPIVMVHPPSPRSVNAKLAQLPIKRVAQVVTPFLLTPHSHPHVPPQQQLSVFARMMSALKNSTPSHSASFTLSPVPQLAQARSDDSAPAVTPTTLLTFHDRTPVFTIGSMNGLLELNTQLAKDLGVQTSFYIAVALTYLEFLTERDVGCAFLSPHMRPDVMVIELHCCNSGLKAGILLGYLLGLAQSGHLCRIMDKSMSWTIYLRVGQLIPWTWQRCNSEGFKDRIPEIVCYYAPDDKQLRTIRV